VSLLGRLTAWRTGESRELGAPIRETAISGSEDRLLGEAASGRRDAFDRLARLHERTLRGYVSRRVGPDAAEDVLQETWLAAWNALADLRGRSRFKAWLFGIAAHKCTDHLRVRGRAAIVDIGFSLEDAAAQSRAPDASGTAARDPYAQAELRHVVDEALAQLPPNQREVLEMYYYAELTLLEIANLLGRNLNTVKYQFYRAHTQVAARLQEDAHTADVLAPGRGGRTP
jgi:RNA polymerase sigma-70 factor (ECF subfamily)